MTTMDMKSISWVDDMYQKFEAMCAEVEETMYQDSVKFVENQVKTVGGCFKRFYSDVMQDLVPPSSDDSVKLENTCQNLVHYANDGIYEKSVVDIKRERVKSESEHLGRDCDLASQLDEINDNKVSSGSYDSSSLYKLPSDESNAVKGPGLHLQRSGYELYLCSNKESEVKVLPSEISNQGNVDSKSVLLSKGSKSTDELGKISDEVNGTVECTSVSSISSNQAVDGFGNDDDELKMSYGFYEPTGDEIDNDDIDKEAFQVSEQNGKLKLDESCVLVDKYENLSVSHLEGKERSYKKKIKDVLYLRRWSRSKNPEQLHLNVVQEEMISPNHGSQEIVACTYASQSSNTKLESNSLESGWEIL